MDKDTIKKYHELLSGNVELTNGITKILNKMEYIGMYVKNGLADDDVIFQSLHMIFFGIVKVCYIFIASKNTDEDKLYTNVIYLYNRWNSRE